MNYQHTQLGYLMIFAIFATALLFVTIFTKEDLNSSMIIFMTLILLLLSSFASLQVTIDAEYLRLKFGYGIYKKSFLLSEIVSVKSVKNHWYYGWGIRVRYKPYMLIYNVSGFDAVEIQMKDRKIYRIGTDEVKKLEHVIIQAIEQSKF